MLRPLLAPVLLAVALCACQAEDTAEPAAEGSEPVVAEEAAVTPDQPKPEGTSTPIPADPDDSDCGADKLGRWLNVLPTDDVKAEIAETVGERTIRYYTQGDPITMDYSPARLNVELGEDGRIKRFRCG